MTNFRIGPDNPLVDAAPAMEHVRALVGKGMSIKVIQDRSGVTERMVRAFHSGWLNRNGGMHPVVKATQRTVDAVLAVGFEEAWDPEAFSGPKFRAVRESRNLSRKVLMKLTGLNESTFQDWEEGRTKPTRPKNMEIALKALEAEWQDVTGPLAPPESDEYQAVFPFDPYADRIEDYPCLVCGNLFRSRRLLAEHPHPRKKVSV